ncbi:hypothetical protein Ancab_036119 [Ancistrocladus abbreviatus]
MADSTPLLSPSKPPLDPTRTKHDHNLVDHSIADGVPETDWRHFLQAIVVSLAWLFDAQQTFISIFTDAEPTTPCDSLINPCKVPHNTSWSSSPRSKSSSIISDWDLQCASSIISGLPASAFFIGCVVGGFLLASLGDSRLGRKNLLLICCFSMSLSSAATALAPNIGVYSGLRFVSGFGRAAIGTCALVLSTELVGKRWQGCVGVIGFVCFALGFLSLPGIAYVVDGYGGSWRALYLYTSLPGLLYCLLLYLFVEESPRWLNVNTRNNLDAVQPLLIHSSPSLSFMVTEQEEPLNADVYAAMKALVSRKWSLKRLASVMVLTSGIGMVYYGVPLGLSDLSFDLYLSVTMNAIAELLACLLIFFVIGKMKRKNCLLWCTILSGVCNLMVVVVGSHLKQIQVGLELMAFLSGCTSLNVALIYTVELFPTCVRNTALSMARQALVFGGIFSPLLVAVGRENRYEFVSYGVFGVVILLCGLFVCCLPETRDSTLCDTMDEEECFSVLIWLVREWDHEGKLLVEKSQKSVQEMISEAVQVSCVINGEVGNMCQNATDKTFGEENVSEIAREAILNGNVLPDVECKKARLRRDITFQDIYNNPDDLDDDEDDSDWEPLQEHVAVTKWFCKNCTMVNFDTIDCCDICGEHRESGILKHGFFACPFSQEAILAQGTLEVIENYKESFSHLPDSEGCTAVGFDERMLLHTEVEMKSHPHPERPDRLRAIAASLSSAGVFPGKCHPIPAREITKEELLKVHSVDHIDSVELTSQILCSYFTPDTYANEHSAQAARLAAGLCADLASEIYSGHAKNGFALVRPPGHHAGVQQAMGFCLHNNAAVAALAAQVAGAKKVLIVDWDVHHGNGTQEIFEGSTSVLYISLHRHEGGRFYPGTGAVHEVGTEGAEGYCVNVPWSCGGVGDNDYIFAFQYVVLPIAREFAPDFTIISAGFDAARGDPLGCCDVTPVGYACMTHMLTALSGGKLLVILEGGYNLRSISSSATAVIKVLLGEKPEYPGESVAPTRAGMQTVLDVLKIQTKYWPSLCPNMTKLRSVWESYLLQSKKKEVKRRRRIVVPIWWKLGRKSFLYHILCRRLHKKQLRDIKRVLQ